MKSKLMVSMAAVLVGAIICALAGYKVLEYYVRVLWLFLGSFIFGLGMLCLVFLGIRYTMTKARHPWLIIVPGLIVLSAVSVYTWQLLGFSARLPFPQIYHITLRANPASPPPMAVRFTVDITGGIDNAPGLYCPPITWDFGDGTLMTRMGSCLQWSLDAQLDRRIEHTYTYKAQGAYQVTVAYGWLTSLPLVVNVH